MIPLLENFMVGIVEGEYLGILELDCTGRSQYGPLVLPCAAGKVLWLA